MEVWRSSTLQSKGGKERKKGFYHKSKVERHTDIHFVTFKCHFIKCCNLLLVMLTFPQTDFAYDNN